jgi:hypothetical protein
LSGQKNRGIHKEEISWVIRVKNFSDRKIFGAVAQMGERRFCTPEVAGSIPVSSTMPMSVIAG